MTWKYNIIRNSDIYHIRKELDKLGSKGWELVSVVTTIEDNKTYYILWLKNQEI